MSSAGSSGVRTTGKARITWLLQEWQAGDAAAGDQLLPLVYDELRLLARRHLARERPGHTLGATALVHEAYISLVEHGSSAWQDRAHFFAIASRVMRRVLVWSARKKGAGKRGGGVRPLTLSDGLDSGLPETTAPADEVLDVDRALDRLEALDERLCRVVECRYFAGLEVAETAEALGVSPATVKRDWQTARAWLRRELGQGRGNSLKAVPFRRRTT
jgi:RNA polymerase sigma factor (TIGR02999 family)